MSSLGITCSQRGIRHVIHRLIHILWITSSHMPVYWVFSALTGVLLLQWENYKTVVIHNVHNPCGKTRVIHSCPQSSTIVHTMQLTRRVANSHLGQHQSNKNAAPVHPPKRPKLTTRQPPVFALPHAPRSTPAARLLPTKHRFDNPRRNKPTNQATNMAPHGHPREKRIQNIDAKQDSRPTLVPTHHQ